MIERAVMAEETQAISRAISRAVSRAVAVNRHREDAQIGLIGDGSATVKTTRYCCGQYNRSPVFSLLLTGGRSDMGLSLPRLREPTTPIRRGPFPRGRRPLRHGGTRQQDVRAIRRRRSGRNRPRAAGMAY